MTPTEPPPEQPDEPSPGVDLVDRTAGLGQGDPTHRLRYERAQVAAATQGAYEALFAPGLSDPTLTERLQVALHACEVGGATALAAHYRERLAEEGSGAAASADDRLEAMLAFTRTLIERPVDGDKAALAMLPAAGLAPAAVVALAQLIAFVSYQIRLVAGLRAIAALEAATLNQEAGA
jgi:uncharacterized protein YciW